MQNTLVDTHVHLCDPVFEKDLEEVLSRARNCGIGYLIAVGEDIGDAHRNLELAEKYTEILPALGLYPANADLDRAEEIRDLIRRESDKIVAIGEVGLDFRIAENERQMELQREVLGMFIDLSLELNLPLNVHSRSAGRYAVEQLLNQGAKWVQMHAFDGKAESAKPAIDAGYSFSIPPSITRSRQKQKLLKQLPDSCLLLETDSPALGPSAQERNEPSNILTSLQTIAEIKNVSESDLRERIKQNTFRLYGELA